MGDIRGFADSPFIWQRVMAGGRLKFYNLIGIVGRAPTRSAMHVIAGRHEPLLKISRGQCQKGGAYYTRVINFPSEFGSKRGVRIIRGCGLYAVKDGTHDLR